MIFTTACSPKEPEDPSATTSGSTTDGTTSTAGSSSSSGETPTTGTSDASSSGSESASASDTGDPTTSAPTTTGDTTTGDMTTTTGTSEGSDDTGPVLACDAAGMSNLDGVCIVFPPQQTSFTLAEAASGLEFDYAVIATADVPKVISEATTTCAEPGPGGLFVRETVSDGADQNYCVCDGGLCPNPEPNEFVLAQGAYPNVFPWDGVNWNGPSDTNNPKGKPFPPGTYTVKVTTTGTQDGKPFEVTGELEITLVK